MLSITLTAEYVLILLNCLFVTYYFTKVLLLSGNGGPFIDTTKLVDDLGEQHFVGLWDRLRELTFAHTIVKTDTKEIWYVKPSHASLFSCAKCLSFWVSFIVCVLSAALFNEPTIGIWFIAVAGIVTYLDK